ncbi:MAG: redoxin domain-containing protein [Bacteroidia bacterium]|nr:redoxin domain-containing protein [Bacteroidia bacterium]
MNLQTSFIRNCVLGAALLLGPVLAAQTQPRLVADFSLRNERNEEVKLSALSGKKAVVVVFTSSNCVWATKYESRLESLYREFEPKQVAFLAINSNDSSLSALDASARMREVSPYPFPYLKDDTQRVAKLFGATRNPEAFVLIPRPGKGFEIAYQGKVDDNPLDAGMVRYNYLQEALQSVLAGKAPAVPETPASGCNIKWNAPR